MALTEYISPGVLRFEVEDINGETNVSKKGIILCSFCKSAVVVIKNMVRLDT
jgi:hypothetical protein